MAQLEPLSLRLRFLSLLGILLAVGGLAVLAFGAGWFTDRIAVAGPPATDSTGTQEGKQRADARRSPGGPPATDSTGMQEEKQRADARRSPGGPPATDSAGTQEEKQRADARRSPGGPPATASIGTREAADSRADQLLLHGDGARWRQASTDERREACQLAAQWLAPEATLDWQAGRAAYYLRELEAFYGDPRWETVPLVELVPLLDAAAERDPG